MKVKLNDGRIGEATDNYAGKSRQVFVDNREMWIARDKLEEVTDEQLIVTTIPAIDRLEEVNRYLKAITAHVHSDVEKAKIERALRRHREELEEQVYQDIKQIYGL